MIQIRVMGFLLLTGLLVAWGTSCSTNGTIFLNISNDSGCNVVATLDGGSPVSNSGNGGPYTLWSNVSHGPHTIGISAYKNGVCNFDITGGAQTCSVDHPCDSGYVLSCN